MKEINPENGFTRIPQHIAIIMDGNGRWAERRHQPRIAGHRAGTENLRRIIKACVEFSVPYLTVYAFSTENWKRPQDEVEGLLNILSEMLEKELDELHKQGVKLVHMGRLEQLREPLQSKVKSAMDLTKDNQQLTLCIAWNYGGRDEIVHAVQKILREKISPEEVTEKVFSEHLYTAGIPYPDLVIRTSGEMRTSNFMLWQSAYSEWFFTPVLWPDFDKEELRKAIIDFGKRERRFGSRPNVEGSEYNRAE
jgi:undecaprenyl diphosphate synthase